MEHETRSSTQSNHLIVFAADSCFLTEAEQLAAHLNIACTQSLDTAQQADLMLRLDADGLTLSGGDLEMRGDFTRMLPRLKSANLQREFLVKASKLKGVQGTPTAVDATAGMGEDSLLLAAAGFDVILYEYDPIIAALLRDTLRRAAQQPELASIVSRMHLIEANSQDELPKLSFTPDIIVLDPMFPERRKSALIKKKFQLLQQLERPCSDEDQLLQAAIQAHPRKIVIKRPLKGPLLAGVKPSHSLSGKAIRYDCIVLPPKV